MRTAILAAVPEMYLTLGREVVILLDALGAVAATLRSIVILWWGSFGELNVVGRGSFLACPLSIYHQYFASATVRSVCV